MLSHDSFKRFKESPLFTKLLNEVGSYHDTAEVDAVSSAAAPAPAPAPPLLVQRTSSTPALSPVSSAPSSPLPLSLEAQEKSDFPPHLSVDLSTPPSLPPTIPVFPASASSLSVPPQGVSGVPSPTAPTASASASAPTTASAPASRHTTPHGTPNQSTRSQAPAALPTAGVVVTGHSALPPLHSAGAEVGASARPSKLPGFMAARASGLTRPLTIERPAALSVESRKEGGGSARGGDGSGRRGSAEQQPHSGRLSARKLGSDGAEPGSGKLHNPMLAPRGALDRRPVRPLPLPCSAQLCSALLCRALFACCSCIHVLMHVLCCAVQSGVIAQLLTKQSSS
jgi:hypothetical protein